MSRLLNCVLKCICLPNKFRISSLRKFGIKVGANVHFSHGIYMNGNKLSIGNNSWVGYRCYFSCINSEIVIGDNVGIATDVKFITDSHEIGKTGKRCGKNISKPITIEDGCWIGAGATILPGTAIKKGCVIAAGSIVRGECESNCLYAGNPAVKIKEYTE